MGIFGKKGGGGGGGGLGGVVDRGAGGALGGAIMGPVGAAYGGMRGGEGTLRQINPWDTTKSNDLAKEAQRNAREQYGASQPILGRMNSADEDFGRESRAAAYSYLGESSKLRDEAANQASNAQATYTNSIQPRLKANMESAMSLQDAGDPNNKIHKAVRGMYNEQGQAARMQGQQDFGVLSALGAQAAQGQFGAAGPMTAGQMGQIYSANQNQAGNAYANAQKRMYDLQQQGIDRGFEESGRQYDRGQQAIGDFIGAEGEYLNRGRQGRAERNYFDQDRYSVNQGLAGMNRDIAYGRGERDLSALGQYYGTNQSIISGRQEEEAARRAGMGQAFGGLVQAGASAYGAS